MSNSFKDSPAEEKKAQAARQGFFARFSNWLRAGAQPAEPTVRAAEPKSTARNAPPALVGGAEGKPALDLSAPVSSDEGEPGLSTQGPESPSSLPSAEEPQAADESPRMPDSPAAPEEPRAPVELPEIAEPPPSSPSPALEINRELEAEIERLTEKLRQRERHLESLREQRNDLHRQLREEKEVARKRLQALEADLVQTRAQAEAANKEELNASRSRAEKASWERQETKRALSKVRDLEAALKQAEDYATELQIELAAQKNLVETLQAGKEAASAAAEPLPLTRVEALSFEKAAELERQAITPLTVLVASADLLAMDPKIDPSLRETALEMKKQSQELMELIKSYTRPPESSE